MTEDLWYHALRFLDKYRTDVRSYDLDELYEFADKTGILERHKQLLAKPFHDSQVDMKIMYYELIKMLIDYERKNHPETYDATKTVGKIEGYQELTNKLQRYLNQRFIEDIDKLAEQQLNITQVNISQKFEQLEANFIQLENRYSSLEQHCSSLQQSYSSLEENHSTLNQTMVSITTAYQGLERTNNSLVERVSHLEQVEASLYEEIRQLREKDVELEQLIGQLQERQETNSSAEALRSSAMEDKIKLGEDTVVKITEQIEKLEAETNKLKNNDDNQDSRLSSLESSSAVLDNKLNNLESADVFLQESYRILTEKTTIVENEIKQNFGHGANLTKRLDNLAGSIETLFNDNNGIKTDIGNIGQQLLESETKTSLLETEVSTGKENIDRIAQALQSINQQISYIESNSSTTWESIEAKLNTYQTDIVKFTSGISENADFIGNIGKEMEQLKVANDQLMVGFEIHKNEILQLQDNQKGNEKNFENNQEFHAKTYGELTDLQGKIGNFYAKIEDMDKEEMDNKSALEMQEQKINKLMADSSRPI